MTLDSTLRDVRRSADGPGPRWGRQVSLALLLVVVVAGAIGIFGVHSSTVSARTNGYLLSVTYARTARAGLDVPFTVRAQHTGGFPSSITLAVSTDYFRVFETQGFYPDADSATNDGRFVYLTFTPPSGDDVVLDFDAYIQPGAQRGKSATVELIVRGSTVATVRLHTWLVP
ncbi:MAG TPA: hypothetical protein VH573_22840 [Mycobacteriales bacterium]